MNLIDLLTSTADLEVLPGLKNLPLKTKLQAWVTLGKSYEHFCANAGAETLDVPHSCEGDFGTSGCRSNYSG